MLIAGYWWWGSEGGDEGGEREVERERRTNWQVCMSACSHIHNQQSILGQ